MDDVNIIPVGQHLIVKVIDDEELKTEEGFVLPKNYHQKPMLGKVTDLSEEFDNSELKLEIGSKVLLPKYGATPIHTNHGEYQLAHRKDIIGVL